MLMSKESLMVVKSASKDPTRLVLNGLHIEPDGTTVATDGKQLVRYTPLQAPDARDYPSLEGCCAVDSEPLVPCTIGTKDVLVMAKMIPTKSRNPRLRYLAVDTAKSNKGDKVYCATTDGKTPQLAQPGKLQTGYTNYASGIPDMSTYPVRVGFTLEVLLQALTTMQACGVTRMVMAVKDARSPVRLTADTTDGKVEGAVMPCRIPSLENPPSPANEEDNPDATS